MEFSHPDNRLISVEWSYTNNILDIPVPVSDGTRKINKQENGLKSWTLILSGSIRNIQKVISEKILLQKYTENGFWEMCSEYKKIFRNIF